MQQSRMTSRVELEFGPVREFGEKWRCYKGNYLTRSLYVRLSLKDKRGERHLIECWERFALDTGSPVTFLRKDTVFRALNVHFDDLELEEQVFGSRKTGEGSYEKGWRIQGLGFPQLGLVLKEAYISAEDRPFSLFGTDFLEHFFMVFDPVARKAVSIRCDIPNSLPERELGLTGDV